MSGDFKFGNVSGPVNAGSGNMNVGSGSQYVAGRDLSVGNIVGADPAAAEAIAELRAELASLRLTAEERTQVDASLDELEQAPDKESAAGPFQKIVVLLKQAGAVASAGSELVPTLTKLASWLGPVAAGAIALL
jgi:hypothetical protein